MMLNLMYTKSQNNTYKNKLGVVFPSSQRYTSLILFARQDKGIECVSRDSVVPDQERALPD
jgi:hypothetical protein